MIRIICSESDGREAAYAGGPMITRHRTFDTTLLPELEAYLKDPTNFVVRHVIGVEILPEQVATEPQRTGE